MLRPAGMEEFVTEDEEPWYDQRDLEQDLHLAAELGKTLLERNKELEDSLQQLDLTNEDQAQEIEYLARQLEVLRDVNEQHAKVYEQLDLTARGLEITNEKLLLEGQASHQKIHRLTSTMEALQVQVDGLTARVQELSTLEELRLLREEKEQRRSVRSFPCLKELCPAPRYEQGFLLVHPGSVDQLEPRPADQENRRLQEAQAALRAALAAERGRREEAERGCGAALGALEALEARLLGAEGCRLRVRELEAELEEMQQLRRSGAFLLGGAGGGATGAAAAAAAGDLELALLADTPETDTPDPEPEGGGAPGAAAAAPVRKSCSDTALHAISGGGEGAGGRRGGGAGGGGGGGGGRGRRGMSILSEVDEQYHALLERYEELLGRCRRHQEGLCHAGVQTSRPASRDPSVKDYSPGGGAEGGAPPPSPPPPSPPSTPEALEGLSRGVEQVDQRLGRNAPEYKTLFKEIFSRLQRTKGRADSSPKGRADSSPKGRRDSSPKGRTDSSPQGRRDSSPKGRADSTHKGRKRAK